MKKELLHIMYVIAVITILVEFLLVAVFWGTFFSQMPILVLKSFLE